MIAEPAPVTLSILVAFDRAVGRWVARCLEYDIAASGEDLDAARGAFEEAFRGQMRLNEIHGKRPLENIPPAPAYVRELFARAWPSSPHLDLPNAHGEIRVYGYGHPRQ